jgi:hypothetical protein
MQPVAFFLSRLPVFMLYNRLFGSIRWFRIACFAGIVAAFIIYVHTLPVVAALCTPRDGNAWTSVATFDQCSEAKPDAIVQGVGNILLDLYALLLPMPIIWTLQMPLKRRLGVATVFLTGSMYVCEIVRERCTFANSVCEKKGLDRKLR